MERLIRKYEHKLAAQGICEPGAPLLGGLDGDLVWTGRAAERAVLEEVVAGLNINSILFAPPAEPYFSIINHLARRGEAIYPEDCETRTFLHDIPVIREFKAGPIIEALQRRKSVVIAGRGIVTYGTVSPEQAFVTFSSVCFSSYVKFFSDLLREGGAGANGESARILKLAADSYSSFIDSKFSEEAPAPRLKGPFTTKEEAIYAMIEAGRLTVECRMVDSFFGNISYNMGDTILVSQTGSSLEELGGYIDACPVDGSSCSSLTASSEYTAHKRIFAGSGRKAILHGHPRFTVIISMLCHKKDCPNRGRCHIDCSEERYFRDIPIVPGEVGTGPTGLCNTLPPAMQGRRGAIVWGHGLFTMGEVDYSEAFANLVDVERACFAEVMERLL